MAAPADERRELRTLILAPIGRDAVLARDALEAARLSAETCGSVDELCRELTRGAGAVLLAEEALTPPALDRLTAALADEPTWSELPIVVLLGVALSSAGRAQLVDRLEPLRNVTLLERPIGRTGLVSAIRSALRARGRQYEVRDLMVQLQRALRTKDELVATVSHELRTPINVILGRMLFLRQHPDDRQRVTASIDVIERNARILWQLVEDLIDVARAASGRFQMRMAAIDLGAVVQAAVETLRPTAEARRIALTCTLPEAPLLVLGDEVRLQQVVWNLVWNAVKFTSAGERIEVGVQRLPTGAEIRVSDTGAGIDPESLPYIFEPFRQGASGSTDAHRGLGLGLAIVRHLIELHGGTIAAASEGLGRGATFVVTLPVTAREGAGTAAPLPDPATSVPRP